jgi:hypothetical protein
MEFRDVNEIDILTTKTDYMLDIRGNAEKIVENLSKLKELGMEYDELFRVTLRILERVKGMIAEETVEKIILSIVEVYKVEEDMSDMIKLLKFYNGCDLYKFDIKSIYTDEFVEKVPREFNIMFAPYYLMLLVERYEEIEEINRINYMLKHMLVEFKDSRRL